MLTASQARKATALYLIKQDPALYLIKQDPFYTYISELIDEAIKEGKFVIFVPSEKLFKKGEIDSQYIWKLEQLGYEVEKSGFSDNYVVSWEKNEIFIRKRNRRISRKVV